MILQLSIILALLAQQISSCPFEGKREMTKEEQELHRKLTNAMTPAHCLTRPSALIPNKAGICRAYNGMKADFLANMPSTNLGKSNLFGAAVRLAFHDAGEANMADPQDYMGPDGCLSSDTENNGLTEDTSIVNTVIEASWQDYCDDISRADFWVLFAKIAMEYAEPTGHMILPFQYGRVDATSCEAGNGRIPDASGGLPGVTSFIFDNMGLNLVDFAALLGAHSLGHVHLANSGFAFPEGDDSNTNGLVNAWDTTPHLFDNNYYKQMLTFNWHNVQNPAHTKGQWKRNPASNFFVMLNVDMALAYDLNLGTAGEGTLNQVCGPFGTENQHFGCYPSSTLMPPTCNDACRYANSNEVWLNAFLDSWEKMTTVGYGLPDYSEGSTSTGKLGTLTTVDLSTC